MATKTEVFRGQVEEIFGKGLKHYSEEPTWSRVSVGVRSNQCTLANLEALSKVVGTDNINFTGRTDETRYSSWTSDTDHYGEIECNGVVFPKCDEPGSFQKALTESADGPMNYADVNQALRKKP